MPRLTSPTGVTVNVSDEKAAQLQSIGYKPVKAEPSEAPKAPAKKSASSKSKK